MSRSGVELLGTRGKAFRTAETIVTLMTAVCAAGQRRPAVFEKVDLRQVIPANDSARFPTLSVRAMRFSPDGERLAVVSGYPIGKDARGRRGLLTVLVVSHPRSAEPTWAIPDLVSDAWGASPSVNFSWSSDGARIFAGGEILSVNGGRPCVLQPDSRGGGFFAPGRVVSIVAWSRRSGYSYAVYDDRCGFEYALDWRDFGELLDITPDRSLAAVEHRPLRNPVSADFEVWVVDPAGGQVRNRIRVGLGGDAVFADGGRTLCGSVGEQAPDHSPVRCWDLDDSRLIAEAKGVNLGRPFVAASGVSRVLVSDYQYTRDPLSSYETSTVLRRRLIWDFRSNKMIAWWRVSGAVPWGIRRDTASEESRRYALSPDGRVLAEGEGSEIRFYRLP